jgi:hypothetical protein
MCVEVVRGVPLFNFGVHLGALVWCAFASVSQKQRLTDRGSKHGCPVHPGTTIATSASPLHVSQYVVVEMHLHCASVSGSV